MRLSGNSEVSWVVCIIKLERRTMDSTDAYNGGRAGDIFENRVNFEYTQLLQF